MELRLNEDFAEFLGIMFGDGCLSRTAGKYIVYICGHKEDEYDYHLNTSVQMFKNLFDKEVKIGFKKNENALFIRFSDKKLFLKLKEHGVPVGRKYDSLKIPNHIKESQTLSKRFIRGFFDTDGTIIFSKQHREKPYYPRLELPSKSRTILEELLNILRTS